MVQIIRERRVETGIQHDLVFELDGHPGSCYAFACTPTGVVIDTELCRESRRNLAACRTGRIALGDGTVIRLKPAYVRSLPWREVIPAVARCDACAARGVNGEAHLSRHCGAWVCGNCGHHLGLARCYCGWSASGGDGYRELAEMGETIEAD